jgi:hypothetical protein
MREIYIHMKNNHKTIYQNNSHNNIVLNTIFFLKMIKYLAKINMIMKTLIILIFNITSSKLKYYFLKTFKKLKK